MSADRVKIVKAMAAMAWSDGRMDKKEKEKLRLLAKRFGLSAGERSTVEGYLMSRPSIQGITFDELNEKEANALFLMALHYAYMDGRVKPGEKRALADLAKALKIPPEMSSQMEAQVKAAKKKR